MKETALVVCPGRGTYNAAELGYFAKHHSDKPDLLAVVEGARDETRQPTISELDGAASFKMSRHGTGDNASALIYACALGDFLAIDRERFDIVAVTGNSMGWYLALACAGALSHRNGAELVNSMGTLMHNEGEGGQIVYPVVDENWRPDPAKEALVQQMLAASSESQFIATSIRLGGLHVFAADRAGLSYLSKHLPPVDDRYPMRLVHHAAFHSALLTPIIKKARANLPQSIFEAGQIPMVDGRGMVWMPQAFDLGALYRYTLGHQIDQTFDFSAAIDVAVKEFAPDRIIVLGPGSTLGAPVAQQLIRMNWRGLTGKQDFKAQQATSPFILSMGIDEQRARVVATA
ncbi:MAG: ACP S-malonyltransferase [Pseudomonadota bacterium]